ncbi:MAG TPA: PAS domain S-box protein [Kamptonema sp.]|nr:PAS domain S-box protein [Kamptonema sp.]
MLSDNLHQLETKVNQLSPLLENTSSDQLFPHEMHSLEQLRKINHTLEVKAMQQASQIRQLEKQLQEEQKKHIKSNQLLARSEARLQSIIRNAFDLIVVLEYDMRIQYESPALEHILGYKPEDRRGKVFGDLIHPDDLPHVKSYLTNLLEQFGAQEPIEFRKRHANNYWVYLEAIGSNFLHDSSVGGIVLNVRDITEKKQNLEKILTTNIDLEQFRETEAKASQLEFSDRNFSQISREFAYDFTVLPDGLFVCEWMTEAFSWIAGYTLEELNTLGWLQFNLIHPDDEQIVWQQIQSCSSSCTKENEYRIITKKGELRWLRDTQQIIWDDEQKCVTRICGICQDITEAKRIEVALRETERTLQRFIKVASLAIIGMDVNGKVTLWNPAAEKLFGWMLPEVEGNRLPIIPEEHTENFYALFQSSLQGEVHNGVKLHLKNKYDSLFENYYSTVPMRDATGKIIGTMYIFSQVVEEPFWARYLRV